MLYESPDMKIIVVQAEDIIRTSGDFQDPDNPGEENTPADGSWAPPK